MKVRPSLLLIDEDPTVRDLTSIVLWVCGCIASRMFAVETGAGCGCRDISLYNMSLRAVDASAPCFQVLYSRLDTNAGDFLGHESFLILSATQWGGLATGWSVMRDFINTNASQPRHSPPKTLCLTRPFNLSPCLYCSRFSRLPLPGA